MIPFTPLRTPPKKALFGKDDLLVVVGELFDRGYVSGLIDSAQAIGMKVLYTTVGRREQDGGLRPLTKQELDQKKGPLINVPLEAGFDLDPSSKGPSPADQLKGVKISDWDKIQLDWSGIEESRQNGQKRFVHNLSLVLEEVNRTRKKGANVLFAHIMAGGVPRAKILMPTMNRVFKGAEDRFLSSEEFWTSELGRLCAMSFEDVTATTFVHLVNLSEGLRQEVQREGARVSYLAYGYHGCEILVNENYLFQYYSPYLQGWAKLKLEQYSHRFFESGINSCVFNAPEILTQSSSIFQGVEVPLYPLLFALRREGYESPFVRDLMTKIKAKFESPNEALDTIRSVTDDYFGLPSRQEWWRYDSWPRHNHPEQMLLMKTTSQKLIQLHRDHKDLITQDLSEVVFKACGALMMKEAFAPRAGTLWLGHEVVAKEFSDPA